MRKTSILILFVLYHTVIHAQTTANHYDYSTALGAKVWDGAGISVKHFFAERHAGELIGYFWRRGFRLTGLYEMHGDLIGGPGLKWYVGPGAHLGFYNKEEKNGSKGANLGIDGVVGLDYKFREAPINVSLDWQPSFEFGDGLGFRGTWGGLGIRYAF